MLPAPRRRFGHGDVTSREGPLDGFLTEEELERVRASVPIVCVDLVLTRTTSDPRPEVGLILRAMPGRTEPVWCHLGGRVRRGETVRAALQRHLFSTLHGVDVHLPPDPQPDYVMQWFPTAGSPESGLLMGHDPRQHAVALVFAVTLRGTPGVPEGGEALDFRWWRADLLDAASPDHWPGSVACIRRTLEAHAR